MIRIQCPTCGNSFSVPDEASGKVGKCRCGEQIRIPGERIDTKDPHSAPQEQYLVPPARKTDASSTAPRPRFTKKKLVWSTVPFGIVLIVGGILYFAMSRKPEMPEITTSTLDYHAGIVNKQLYQKDDLLKELDKELGTSFSSQFDPEFRSRIDRESLDRAANVTSIVRFSNKFDELAKEMDKELKELNDLVLRYRPNPRLQRLVADQQAGRDRVEGIIKALYDKLRTTLDR